MQLQKCINFKGEFNNVLNQIIVFKTPVFLKNISHFSQKQYNIRQYQYNFSKRSLET